MKRYLLGILCFILTINFGFSQDEKIRILFIFDGSNSMRAQWQNTSKIAVARKLTMRTLDSLQRLKNVELALRLYGHQSVHRPGFQDCNDTKLEVPFAPSSVAVPKMKSKLRAMDCKGTTPIALSLEQAGNNDFPECENCRNVIILITDGVEACDGDPCAVARALKRKGINLKPFIIGVGLDTSYLGQFGCVGEFLSADTEDSFENVLSYVVSQAVNNTTVQVNLNDSRLKPIETDVTMSFYNQKSGGLMETFMHTFDVKRKPDVFSLNPLFTYKMVVHTIPEIVVENIKLTPGKHNVIDVNASQGYLKLSHTSNQNRESDIQCVIKQNGKSETIHVQELNTRTKYLVGKYDIEMLTLPRQNFNGISVKQGVTTNVTIPQLGYLKIDKRDGPCQVFEIKNGEERWVCDVPPSILPTTLSLIPGKYKVVYRFARNFSTANTIEKTVRIVSDQQEHITL